MQLSKDQIDQLKQLTKMPWWKIIKEIEDEVTNTLWRELLRSKLTDKDIEIIKRNQIYMEARQDFIFNIEKHLKEVYTPEFNLS